MAIFVLTTPSLPAEPSSYTFADLAPDCKGTKKHICYIIATDGHNQPVMPNALLEEIVTALNTNTESLNVKLKP